MAEDLKQHIEAIGRAKISERVCITVTAQAIQQLKVIAAFSMMAEKIGVEDLFKLYQQKGGSRAEIEAFLKR